MRRLQKIVCFVLGHKTSLFPGVGPPMALQWAYPDPTAPKPLPTPVVVATSGNIIIPSPITGSGYNTFQGPPIRQGPTFHLDLCRRCLALYVNEPPPVCVNCNSEKSLHEDDFCVRPCQNCGKPREVHIDNKCPFEASSYKGTKWRKSTSFGSQ